MSLVQYATRADNRGHGAEVADELDTSDLEVDEVSTRAELAALLQEVHVRAGMPSVRDLEARTRHAVSKTVAAEILNGVRFPRKTAMVAFLRACRVQDAELQAWQRAWDRVAPRNQGQTRRSVRNTWHFTDSGPVTLICPHLPREMTSPLADPANPNYTEFLSFADLDALVELYGHIRAANPAMDVSIKPSSSFDEGDLSGHLVLIGGIAWNEITEQISKMSQLPIRQVVDAEIQTLELFVVERGGEQQRFLSKWDADELIEDIGLIARTPNPFNTSRSLTICNGIHSRGVVGAVRALTDAKLRESNERYLAETFSTESSFAILMRVPVIARRTTTPEFRSANCILYQWSRTIGNPQD